MPKPWPPAGKARSSLATPQRRKAAWKTRALPGLTAGSLRQYLRNSHNFPAAMNFTLARRDLNDLSTYMLTLRRAKYRPGI